MEEHSKKYGLEVKILHENLTENEALDIEKRLITEYGRLDKDTGCLINLTDGGEGVSGLIYTLEMKKRIFNDDWKRAILRGAEKRKLWREKHAEGLAKFYGTKYFGKLRCPEGKIYEVYNVTKFCEEHNLVINSFRKLKTNVGKTYKGWTYLGS